MRIRRMPARQRTSPTAPARARLLLLGAAGGLFALLGLAACGSVASPGGYPRVTATPPNGNTGTPGSTGTPSTQPQSYAYLYSRIDYPMQVPVNASDLVTLTLSTDSAMLSVTPGPGSGTGALTQPIPLPTDLGNYADIGASVDTVTPTGAGPIAWALISAPRQSLLEGAAGADRRYRDATFQWRVTASAPGQNTVNVTLYLYYVYLDGSEHDGTIQISQAPIPMVAVDPTPVNTTLPPLRLPLAGLTGLAGIVAVVRFVAGAIRTYHDITDPVKDVATAAHVLHSRLGGSGNAGQQQAYPNPWAQPPALPPNYPPQDSSGRPWPPSPR